ncbi:hypothetical protein A2783_01560 [Microgenomates group bacterium RIFCSPHIGHO2_01_FULL_45_11]|nr:MAG: hypothetical protein A2783_01560 [Microgenomates group bacterium RIFCSPHIGHO2_01_FULL_45_11]
MKKYLVLSPHMDDAIFSCCDHILFWQQVGIKVEVVNLFTSFRARNVSLSLKRHLAVFGFDNAGRYEKVREEEDREALAKLGLKPTNLDVIDGFFRKNGDNFIYSNRTLFSGKISSWDRGLVERIKQKLADYKFVDKVIVPLGVGLHVDHLIAREVSENVFGKKKIMYFVDSPYYLRISNWRFNFLVKLLRMRWSIKKISFKKKQLLQLYTSQYSLLFKQVPSYYEIVLS